MAKPKRKRETAGWVVMWRCMSMRWIGKRGGFTEATGRHAATLFPTRPEADLAIQADASLTMLGREDYLIVRLEREVPDA